MTGTKSRIKGFMKGIRIAAAVTRLAVVAVPVATTVGLIVGYGAYSLLRKRK